jgi:hypothetical protein
MHTMRKRLLAAGLMAALFCWAEPVTPLLALATSRTVDQHAGSHSHSATEPQHACCPHAQAGIPEHPLATLASPAKECGQNHRCCLVRSPEQASTPPEGSRRVQAVLLILSAASTKSPQSQPLRRVLQTIQPDSYSSRNMILRI